MRIGEVAERAGVKVETLRYYERRGLLPEPARGPSGHRSYDEDAVRFVRAIKEAQGLGFTLTEIEEYLRAARGTGRAASEALRVRLAEKIDEVDAKLASLRRVRDDLARIVGCACDSLDHCTCGAAYLARRGHDPETNPGALFHVTNGESAGNTLRQTTLGGAVLPWQDVLHEGPVPAVPAERLRALRARFLSECGWGDRRSIADEMERRDRLFSDALAERRHVVLWFEHDLHDQLQLLQILATAEEADYDPARLQLINVGTFEGRPDFHGLGELTADELESLWPKRRPVTDELTRLASAAWDAFRAPAPTALGAWVDHDSGALPFLEPALRRLLELLAEAPATPAALFVAWQTREAAPFLGDAWFYGSLAVLGAGAGRLVALAGGDPLSAPPPHGDPGAFAGSTIELTRNGHAVLAGAADRVELLGIDRWLGGTHLEADSVWRRRRDGTLVEP
jgi:DNA-binding transcriptional MerR regulator